MSSSLPDGRQATAYRTPYHFGNLLIDKAQCPMGSPKFPLNSFQAYRPCYPEENLSCLCLSLQIGCWLHPNTTGSSFSILFCYEATYRFTHVTVCLFVSPTYSGICRVASILQITPQYCTSDYIADRPLRWGTLFSSQESKELRLARGIVKNLTTPAYRRQGEHREFDSLKICKRVLCLPSLLR